MLLLVLFALLADEILVMKNGKRFTCARYEVTDGRVLIWRDGEQMFLPEKLIDWQRTERVRADRLARAEAEATAAREAAANPKPKPKIDRLEISSGSGTRPLQGDGASAVPLERVVTIAYRKVGNAIIVPVRINGQGPYAFLLDTGASATVVTPSLITRLGVDTEHKGGSLTGVGGSVPVAETILSSIGIEGAVVRDLPIVVHGIDVLQSQQIAGLLGQDYLEYFNTSFDTENRNLTLRRNSNAAELDTMNRLASLEDPRETFRDIARVAEVARAYSRTYIAEPGRANIVIARVKETRSVLAESRRAYLEMRQAFRDVVNKAEPDMATQAYILRFLKCDPLVTTLFDVLEDQLERLELAAANPNKSYAKDIEKGLADIDSTRRMMGFCGA